MKVRKECENTWVGNLHIWIEVRPNPLGLWKRILGKEVFVCEICGKKREGFSTAEWSG